MEDVQAIGRLKRGDIGGLECLIGRYQTKALRTAFLITHDEALAEDVVQDAFLKFFRSVHRFDEHQPFRPYFFRSVTNAAVNCLRREKRIVRGSSDREDELITLVARASSVEEEADFNVLRQQILEALAQLSPRQRAAVISRYYLEMSEKEMSEVLTVPLGTVKWLLSAARGKLRILLRSERTPE